MRPRGGIGRHKGLKIPRSYGHAGSSPATGTTHKVMNMKKPIVRYRQALVEVVLGRPALVEPIDHPSELVSNNKPVWTSDVVGITLGGFETRNTQYVLDNPRGKDYMQ